MGVWDARDKRVCVNLPWSVVFLHHFPEKMKVFSWLSCIFVAVAAVTAEDAKVPPTELQIETTFKPVACPNQAKARDHIDVHYVSRYGTAILI
jgi:hypothetical protein